jgi:hypothetical protein
VLRSPDLSSGYSYIAGDGSRPGDDQSVGYDKIVAFFMVSSWILRETSFRNSILNDGPDGNLTQPGISRGEIDFYRAA